MQTDLQRFRFLQARLASRFSTPRLIIITGARQTGKTTLAKTTFADLNYVNLDAFEFRELVRTVRTTQWAEAIGEAVLDEAQKEPTVFDKVKFAFDAGEIERTVLLGSSQFLLLEKVRESLAGRAFVFTLWPLLASELVTPAGNTPPTPLIDSLLTRPGTADTLLTPLPNTHLQVDTYAQAIDHLIQWGGMPALLPLPEGERHTWLRSYATAYLERDLGDLARLRDLMPFRQFQRLCALRSGQILSYAQLGRDAGLSATTSRRYLEYLRLSYQAIFLPPYSRNLTSQVIKSPKLYWLDVGLWREQTGYRGGLTGQLFETLIVTELVKWIKTHDLPNELFFYRTRSGLEVDLLMTTSEGVWGIEIKSGQRLGRSDWRGLRQVAERLGSEWRGGLIVHRGKELKQYDANLWAVPVERLLVG